MDVLIEATELAALLADHSHDQIADGRQDHGSPVLIDVRWSLGGPSRLPDFLAEHIPGAHWVDLETELSDHDAVGRTGAGGRHPLPQPPTFEAAMRRAGVNNASTVIVYDADNALAASRLWWMLVDAGHQRVRVLNGGYAAWIAADGAVENGPGASIPPGDFRAAPGQLPTVDGAALAARIAAGDAGTVIDAGTIIDVRGAERYAGESEPIDPIAGHIPGAINVPSMINIDSDGRFRTPTEIADNFADAGAEPVVYCGSGITAAHTALARAAAGLSIPTVYPGSWSDWITDRTRPIATGDRP